MSDFFFTPELPAFQKGMEVEQDRSRSRRLDNVKALRELSDMAAKSGQSLGVDDWAEQARSVLGNGEFLRSTAPSAQMLEAMRARQNEDAAKVREEQRRSQFISDRTEEKAIEEIVAKETMAGRTEAEVFQNISEQFPDRAKSLASRLPAIMNRAKLDARANVSKVYGDTFNDVDGAKSFIDQNPGLTKFESDAIMEFATRKQAQTDQLAFTAGEKIGSSLSFDPAAEGSTRAYIEQALPADIIGPRRAQLVERGMTAAREAYRASLTGKQNSMALDRQAADANGALERERTFMTMEEEERKRRQTAASDFVAQYNSQYQSQLQYASKLDPKKKPYAPQLQAVVANFIVDDLDGLVAAFEAGDARKVEAIKAGAQPRAEYENRVRQLSSIITGAKNFSTPQEARRAVDQIILGNASPLAQSGAIYVSSINAVDSAAKQKASPRASFGSSQRSVSPNAGVNMEMLQTRRAEAQRQEMGFVEQSVGLIRDARQVLSDNGTVSMTPEEVAQADTTLVNQLIGRFLSKSGATPEQTSQITQRLRSLVMQQAGEPLPIVRRPTSAEQLRGSQNTIMQNRQLVPDNGWLPAPAPTRGAAAPSAPQPTGGPAPNQQWWR